MPFIPYEIDVTLGEPIASLTIDTEDQFYLALNIFDDQGAAWPDDYTVDLFMYMSESDLYSGSGTYASHFSGTTLSGSANVLITSSGTATPGEYKMEVVMSSGSGATDPVITAGNFDFTINGD